MTDDQHTLEASREDISASDNKLLNLGPWVETQVPSAPCSGGRWPSQSSGGGEGTPGTLQQTTWRREWRHGHRQSQEEVCVAGTTAIPSPAEEGAVSQAGDVHRHLLIHFHCDGP